MEVHTSKENLVINKLVAHKRETFIVEGDMIVPDVKPDVLNTINVTGNICTYKKELLENKVKIEGSANVYIMYLADSENDFTRGINTSIDFSKIINVDNVENNMMMELNINIISAESRVLNGRKINIKLTVEADISIYSNENIEILKSVENIQDLQKLEKHININTLVGTGSARTYAKDTLNIENINNLSEILSAKINIINKEEKVSYNKVLLKADANIRILYLTDEGTIKSMSSNIPIMGFIDVNDVAENNIINTNYQIKNILMKPNSIEEHSIYVEIELETNCMVYDTKQIELIQDIYSPGEEIDYNMKSIEAMTGKQNRNCNCDIEEKISIPEIENNQIYSVEVNPIIKTERIVNGRIMYEGEIEMNFIFSSNNTSGINMKKHTIPFNFEQEIEGLTSDKTVNSNVNCISDEFNVISDRMIECRMRLQFSMDISTSSVLNIIDDIKVLEDREINNSSLIIYIVKQGDSLWNLAKKYRTTMKEIATLNDIEDVNRLIVGEKLLIPRYSKNKLEYTA